VETGEKKTSKIENHTQKEKTQKFGWKN
jgi:hypothetical protein